MEPRAHHILIGFFTIATAMAAMLFVLWLGKAGGEKQRVAYDIVFQEDVKGLAAGSAVLYSGISVGEVVSLRLDRDDPRKVWTRIRVDRDTPMLTSTTARMSMANITGASVILLENDTPNGEPLAGDGDDIPVIPSKPSPFNQLRTSGEELLVSVTRLVNKANDILSDENVAYFSGVLANLEQTTSAFARQKDNIGQGIDDLAAASAQLKETARQANALLLGLNRQLDDNGAGLLQRANDSLQAVAELSTGLNRLLEENQQALGQGAQGLAEVGPVLHKVRELVDHLNHITRALEEDPGGYLLGGEKIREYQP